MRGWLGQKGPLKNQKGQASIMLGMMVMTFMLFFLFVINTGMLVNAKINLQNAADLAAYAGAATQARQLNHISYLNYEMRRQYKKFLFRYYVMGNMAQKSHPKAAGSPGTARNWQPDGTSNADFKVPSVCITFKQNDNYCWLTELPSIRIPPATFGDAISGALRQQLITLEKVRQDNCGKIAESNLRVLLLWLFNTDPELKNFSAAGATPLAPEAQKAFQTIKGLSMGLGLLPRELILKQRIKTLESYVNAPAETELTSERVTQLQGAAENASKERPIQAFLSAYYSLGNHTFPGELLMEELLPGDSDQAQLLRLQDIQSQFATYALMYELASLSGTPVPGVVNGDPCTPKLAPVVIQNLPVGVAKDPTILTYYAVKLRAKARILFSPFGDVELKAYAAAQPFGSRIGPPRAIVEGGFTHKATPDSKFLPASTLTIMSQLQEVPNLPIFTGDTNQPTLSTGWNTNFLLFNMYQKFGKDAVVPTVITSADLERAYQAAMVPNPWESQYYNFPTDLGADPFIRHFDTRQILSLWAPVFPASKIGNGKDILRQAINDAFKDPADLKTGNKKPPQFEADLATMKTILVENMNTYLDALSSGTGEDGEGINVARLRDPFSTRAEADGSSAGGSIIKLDPQIMIRDVTKAKTSWNEVNDGNYRAEGRVGYSVKFVSFDSLTKNKLPTNGSDVWTNELPRDGDSDADVELIRH